MHLRHRPGPAPDRRSARLPRPPGYFLPTHRVFAPFNVHRRPELLLADPLARSLDARLRVNPPARTRRTKLGLWTVEPEGAAVSADASDMVSIPRANLDALQAELRRLRREAGRATARDRIQADPGPGDDALMLTRDELAEAWGIRE